MLSKYNSTNNNGKKKGREKGRKRMKRGQEIRNLDRNKPVKEKK